MNQNNDIFVYRGETCALDFKISQRSDYYVPFLISDARNSPRVCITIGSTRRESKNIVTKQIWIELGNLPRFSQTIVSDLGEIDNQLLADEAALKAVLAPLITAGIMYQYTLKTEVAAGNTHLHFAYLDSLDAVVIDDYDFTIIMSLDEHITLDMTGTDYFYQIELMDTVSMLHHLVVTFQSATLRAKMSTSFQLAYPMSAITAVNNHWNECIALINKTWPNSWGHRINDPFTSPVASVSNIQIIQPPRAFTVQSVVK